MAAEMSKYDSKYTLPEFKIKCDNCNASHDIRICKRKSDTDFGFWQCWWVCPTCNYIISQIHNNTSLTHPLQDYSRIIDWTK